MEIVDLLKRKALSKKSVQITYHGGSQPGSVRVIIPLKVADDKVLAKCIASGRVKMFLIGKISVCDPDKPQDATGWSSSMAIEGTYASLDHAYGLLNQRVFDSGFFLRQRENEISIHKKLKSGNPAKNPFATLRFEEFARESVYDESEESLFKVVVRKRSMPWIVRFENKQAMAFKYLNSAVKSFINEAIGQSG